MRDEEKHEWDRLLGESSKAYAAFCAYRDLGPNRSIVRAIKTSGKQAANLRQWEYWSSQYRWVDRASAYDDHSERHRLAQLEKERREMNERQAKIGVLGQNLAVKGVEKLLADLQAGEKNLGAAELARLLDVSSKLERLARGEPTDSHEVSGPSGGPVKLDLAQTLKRIDEVYGLKTEDGAGKSSGPGDGSGTSEP